MGGSVKSCLVGGQSGLAVGVYLIQVALTMRSESGRGFGVDLDVGRKEDEKGDRYFS